MTENVKIYTPEELEALGWEFTTANNVYSPQYDQAFLELMLSEDIPADLPSPTSLQKFKPYFNGPKTIPSLGYNKFTPIQILCDMEKDPDVATEVIPEKWVLNLKAGAFAITGLRANEALTLKFTLSCYIKGDTPLPFQIAWRRAVTDNWTIACEAMAYKWHTPGTAPQAVKCNILLNRLNPGDVFQIGIIRDNKASADKNLYIYGFYLDGATIMRSYTTAKKKFTDPKTGEVRSYANDPVLCTSPADSRQSAAEYASCIEYGEQVIVAGEPGKMYFPEEELYQWISPQQLDQFKKMYPDCVEISYNSALGYVYSQIGELYDIASILAGDTNDGTAKIMRWILTVLTAYNITSPSARHSETLRDNYEMVVKKVTEMKNGATTLHDAPIKETPNAWGTVVNGSKNKMRG